MPVSPSVHNRSRSPGATSRSPSSTWIVPVHAEGPREDAPVRVRLGLLLGDLALHHHPMDERVVLGDLRELAAAEQVRPGVADVDEVHPVRRRAEPRSAWSPCPETLRSLCERSNTARLASRDLLGERALPRARTSPARSRARGSTRPRRRGGRPSRRRPRTGARAPGTSPRCPRGPGRCPSSAPTLHLHRLSSRTVLPTFTTSPAWTSTGRVDPSVVEAACRSSTPGPRRTRRRSCRTGVRAPGKRTCPGGESHTGRRGRSRPCPGA